MDRQSVYSLSVLPPDPDASENSRSQIQALLREFILEFRLDNAFIYRYVVTFASFSIADYLRMQRPNSRKRPRKAVLLRRRHSTRDILQRRVGA